MNPFSSCSITTLYLGRDISYSSSYSPFKDIESLIHLTIGNKVTSIKSGTFSGCSGLLDVVYNAEDCVIGTSNFDNLSNIKKVIIGEGVVSIPEKAFYNCSGLLELEISNSVSNIGNFAFAGCSGLEKITSFSTENPPVCNTSTFSGISATIPVYVFTDKIKYENAIGWNVFTNFISPVPTTFIALNQDEKELTYSIPTFEKYNSQVVNLVAGTEKYRGSIVIPEEVVYDKKLFRVTTIGEVAFSGCNTLTSVTFPESIEIIGDEAFYNCSRIQELELPCSLKTIGTSSFEGCSRLQKLVLDTNLELINAFAFAGCTGLTEIYSLRTTPAECDIDVFLDIDTSIPVYIPKGAKAAYQSAPEWKNFTNFIESEFTGIEETEISESSIKVIAGNCVEITDYYGDIRIINLSGQVVKDMYVSDSAQITLPKGVYIVVTKNKSQKIIL